MDASAAGQTILLAAPACAVWPTEASARGVKRNDNRLTVLRARLEGSLLFWTPLTSLSAVTAGGRPAQAPARPDPGHHHPSGHALPVAHRLLRPLASAVASPVTGRLEAGWFTPTRRWKVPASLPNPESSSAPGPTWSRVGGATARGTR